jgi:hypothetical protein
MGRYLALLAAFIFLAGFGSGVYAQDESMAPTEEEAAEAVEGAAEEMTPESESGMEEATEALEGEGEFEIEEEPSYEAGSSGGGIYGAMDRFLQSGTAFFDDNKLFGKIRITPSFGHNVIYDSNIFLNDDDEEDTEGVESDVIFSTSVGLAAVMEVNKEYTKIFDRDRLTVLSYDFKSNMYLDHDEVNNIGQDINTDLFGFFNDLLNAGDIGKNLYFRVYATYTDLTDPLDALFRTPFVAGFPEIEDVDDIRRQDLTAGAEFGWIGNKWDVAAGYEYYRIDFKSDLFEQAEHVRNTGWIEAGMEIPGLKDKRVFARFKYSDYRFTEHLLNDAEVSEYTIGFEGSIFTKKIKMILEGSYLEWEHQDEGAIGDDSDYEGGVGWGKIVYLPMEDRPLVLQLEGGRKVQWSAIANYRVDDSAMLTVRDVILPDRLDADVTLYWSHHRESEGPKWNLIEAGAGLTYHLHRQVDITLRYLYRYQDSWDEILITNIQTGDEVETDGDFDQHVVSLGFQVRF